MRAKLSVSVIRCNTCGHGPVIERRNNGEGNLVMIDGDLDWLIDALACHWQRRWEK